MLCNRKPVGPSVKLDMRVRFRFIAIENRVNGYFILVSSIEACIFEVFFINALYLASLTDFLYN